MKPITLLSNFDLHLEYERAMERANNQLDESIAEYERAKKIRTHQPHEYSFREIKAEIIRRFVERMEIKRHFSILKDL